MMDMLMIGDEDEEDMNDFVDWDFFNQIPEELILKILSYLSPYKDTKAAKLVNWRWNRLITSMETHNDRAFLESMRHFNIVWQIHKQRSYDITDTLIPGRRLRKSRAKVLKPNENVPQPRFSHSSVLLDEYLYIFGGSASSVPQSSTFNDLFRLDLSNRTWERVKTEGISPEPRECATFVGHKKIIPIEKHSNPSSSSSATNIQYSYKKKLKIVMFGGWCQPPLDRRSHMGARFYEDTYIFHTDTLRWEKVIYKKDDPYPTARAGHSASVIGDLMVVFGGSQRNIRLNDVWVFDMNLHTWRTPSYFPNDTPRERFGHSQFSLNKQSILIFGGCGGLNELFSDAWLLDVKSWNWRKLRIRNTMYEPPDLWCHASVMVGQDIVVFSEEKKCQFCECPIQHYKIPENGPMAGSSVCACGRDKTPEAQLQLYQPHLQMYILDCTTLFANSELEWLPYCYLLPAPPTRKLFSANLGINEILLFGGLGNTGSPEQTLNRHRFDDCTIVVKTLPMSRAHNKDSTELSSMDT